MTQIERGTRAGRERLWDRAVFLRAALCALAWGSTHLYAVMRLTLSHDSLAEFFTGAALGNGYTGLTWKIALGRFVTPVYEKLLRGTVCAPWLIGLLAMVYLALAVFVTARVFGLRRTLPIFLAAGVMVANPAVFTAAATYIREMDCDMLALLLSTLAAWCWRDGDARYAAAGAACVALSMGIYASYLSVTVVMMMLVSIERLLRGESAGRTTVRGLWGIAMILAGLGLYALMAVCACRVSGVALAGGYNSILNITSEGTRAGLLGRVGACYAQVWRALSGEMFGHGGATSPVAVLALCGVGAALLGRMAARRIGARSAALALALVALLPVGMNLSMLANAGVAHDLMKYAFLLVYLLPLPLLERLPARRAARLGALALAGCVGVLCWQYVVQANQIYVKKDLEDRYTFSLMTRVMTQVEQHPDYQPGVTPLLLAGNLDARVNERGELSRYWGYTGLDASTPVHGPRQVKPYLEYVLGLEVNVCDGETRWALINTEEVRGMPVYPADGSIRMVEGVLVVKLGPLQ